MTDVPLQPHELDEAVSALKHALKRETLYRPLQSDNQRRLFDNPSLCKTYDDALVVYWQFFVKDKSPASVVFRGIDLLTRVLILEGGVGPLTNTFPAAALWIACKVVLGQDNPYNMSYDFLAVWHECQECEQEQATTRECELLEADAYILHLLDYDVFPSSPFDMLCMCLRICNANMSHKASMKRRIIQTLMIVEGRQSVLNHPPSHVVIVMCELCRIPAPTFLPITHVDPELRHEIREAWLVTE